MLNKFHAFSQYAHSIKPKFRSSACGPTAVASILNHYNIDSFTVNSLYRKLYCTPIGLPAVFLLYFSKRLLPNDWTIKKINVALTMKELDNHHPVALKFDRYFNRRFWRKPYFNYHWTVVVGYEYQQQKLFLLVEDLGSPQRDSKRHLISYEENKHALTFIKIRPSQTF